MFGIGARDEHVEMRRHTVVFNMTPSHWFYVILAHYSQSMGTKGLNSM